MESAERFARAVASLPEAVRRRLDVSAPLDWTELGTSGVASALGEAVRENRRLPEPVEALVLRLIREVGIVPADVADGIERQVMAGAWIDRVSIEPEGETYRIRNQVSGELHCGIRTDAIAGYALLALKLAAEMHETGRRWLEAGERYRRASEDALCPLARCAVRMYSHLRTAPKACPGRRMTTILANILETAWNSQTLQQRTELTISMRPNGVSDASAPRLCHFAPMTSFRLHACDLHEIRWLRGLAEQAGRGAPEAECTRAESLDAVLHGTALDKELAALESLCRQPSKGGALGPSPPSDGIGIEGQFAALEHAAGNLPGAVKRRLAAAYGVDAMLALTRLEDRREVEALRAWLTASGREAKPPRWLETLAAALLLDSGAQTHDGLRTASLRLDPGDGPDGAYLATEEQTRAQAILSPAGLVEQMHLGLTFARNAWTALTVLRRTGRESAWTLSEEENACAGFAEDENETLEAARQIGRALDRILDICPDTNHAFSALEQAAMAADALAAVGPKMRTAAGWPCAAEAPNAANADDIARIAAVAEALQDDVRAISDRLIAGQTVRSMPQCEKRGSASAADTGLSNMPV